MEERPVTFSASSVSAYLDCHLQWWFGYILMVDATTDPQAVGQSVHDYAEQRLKGVGVARLGTVQPKLWWQISPLLEVFETQILPTYRDPVLIEAPFSLEINDIPFSGFLDAVDRHDMDGRLVNILRDTKTTASRPRPGKYRFNMIGYWLGAEQLGYPPDAGQLDYIVRTKHPYYWPEVVPKPDADDLAWFTNTLESVAAGVARADFLPTGLGTWHCAACPYNDICGPYQRYKELIQ